MSDTDATCAVCGAQLPAGARFCPSCGAVAAKAAVPPPPPPVAVAAPPPPPPTVPPPPPQYAAPATPRGNKTSLAVVLVLVGLFVVGLVGIAGIAAWTTLRARTHGTVARALESMPTSPGARTGEAPSPPPVAAENPPVTTPVDQISLAGVGEGEHVGPVESGDQAAALVINLPDVQEWVTAIDKARAEGKQRTAMVTVERKPSGHYLVHLFENVEDDDPGHTATFGWYDVDNEMGAITPDDAAAE